MLSADPTASQPQPFLESLRAATSRSHDALHHNAMLRPLADGHVTVSEYRDLMLRFLGYYRTLDPILAAADHAFAGHSSGPTYEPRCPFFERDLRALDADLTNVPECPAQPGVASLPELAGALYVIEGSSLGGSILERAAAKTIPPEARSYWIWCRENCAERWRMTRRLLDRLETRQSRTEAIRAAEAHFDTMLAWFEYDLNASRARRD